MPQERGKSPRRRGQLTKSDTWSCTSKFVQANNCDPLNHTAYLKAIVVEQEIVVGLVSDRLILNGSNIGLELNWGFFSVKTHPITL